MANICIHTVIEYNFRTPPFVYNFMLNTHPGWLAVAYIIYYAYNNSLDENKNVHNVR